MLKDFHVYLETPEIVRQVRDLAVSLRATHKTIVLLSPTLKLPVELEKSVTVIDLPLPGYEDLSELLNSRIANPQVSRQFRINLNGSERDALIRAAQGLTLFEAENAFARAIVRDNILESISQIKGQIVIKVQSDSLEHNKKVADQILANVQSVKGVMRAFIDRDGELPQYVLEFDRAQAARYGINVADVQDLMESALGGKAATELWEGEKHFSVVVRLKPGERELPNLPNIFMQTADGAQVPLSQLVTFRAASGAMNISRENGQRTTSIGIFIHDRDMGSVVKDMQELVKKNVNAEDVKINWSGEFENQERAMARLSIVVPISIALIGVLLFMNFGSIRDTLLALSVIPMATVGGIVALYIFAIPFSISAAIGFIALFGISVMDGIIVLDDFNRRVASGVERTRAIIQTCETQMRPVVMTCIIACVGLLPAAVSTGIGSQVQKPLAMVVVGGMLFAPVLILVILPVLILTFSARKSLVNEQHSAEEFAGAD